MQFKTLLLLFAIASSTVAVPLYGNSTIAITAPKHTPGQPSVPLSGLTSASEIGTQVSRSDEGRPGKIPYRRFPKCYADCFDSEGTDDKTWPAIGDIRDLTTDEFCHQHWTWVGIWFKDHLQFCTSGQCENCHPTCDHEAKITFRELCGTPG